MPTKKKTAATEPETVKLAESAAPAKKKAAAKKPATTPAATHKAPARKKAAPAPFDPAEHHAEIALEAYLLWERRGYTHGSHHDDWLAAVEIVRTRKAN